MWSKKYWRVNFKLAVRHYQSKPQTIVFSGVSLVVITMFSFFLLNYHEFKSNSQVSTFTKWQTLQKTQFANSRTPASGQKFNCSSPADDLNQIKIEIKNLENKYQTGSVLEGKVFGINLSKLPSIAAQMLADNKSLIGDQQKAYDFSFCKSVQCIFNSIYKDDSKLVGNYIYYWYLKTGSMISTTNYIPNQSSHKSGTYNNRPHNLEHYLFTVNELKSFYLLAKSLPRKLTYLPLLKSFHKIPNGVKIENNNSTTLALPNGQILLTQQSLSTTDNNFFINITSEIARYADRQEGLKRGVSSISTNDSWLDQSLWFKESYFNYNNHKFTYKWNSRLPSNQFLNKKSMSSPTEQLSRLIANYRFNPEFFKARTPSDIANNVKTSFFHGKTYDGKGLYYSYLNQTLNEWSKQEMNIWANCIESHLQDEDLNKSSRNLASTLDHPLYSCVERKIPGFIDYTVNNIQKDNFEGCQFFTDHTKYGHITEKYFTSVNKFLNEKILQRKIEIQKHGTEVLIGQKIKNEFVSTIDPKTIYINCFNDQETKKCYNKKIVKTLESIMDDHKEVSEYYSSIIREDILNLFPFDEVKFKSNESVKMFLAPYNARLTQAATKLWDSCKVKGMDHNERIKLPMTFSGGRYYINAKLINCINSKVNDEIYELAQMSAFHKNEEGKIEFKLNSNEQTFALSFLKGNLLQTLNNILDKEYLSEKIMFNDHLQRSKIKALTEFSNKDEFIKDIFSKYQVTNMCLGEVKKYYPKNYFYHAKSEVDKKFGRKICSAFTDLPKVKSKISAQISSQWIKNKEIAEDFLKENYSSLVNDCINDYPKVQGYGAAKNDQLRNTCIRLSYNQALSEAINDWKDHKHHKYFSNRQQELHSFLDSKRNQYISTALQ